jgi:hypothetical protein
MANVVMGGGKVVDIDMLKRRFKDGPRDSYADVQ